MDNFKYYNPTKVLFGADTHLLVGEEVKKYADKILLHFGGGSIKSSGLYQQVTDSLKAAGVAYVELGGVQPNPRLSLVYEGIKLCKQENIRFILAVGGGSVIDSAKAIAMGVEFSGDVWDLYSGDKETDRALPVATILTIPAAGSECSSGSVISNESTGEKLAYGGDFIRPVFSILNPELCYTLPKYQMACGVSDMIAHAMERYFTNTPDVDYTDRILEASIRSIIHTAPLLLKNMQNYDAWCNIMWAGSMVHNGILGAGREEDWGSHDIEHQLSAVYDIAHGAGLSIIFPAWMRYVYGEHVNRFVQFAMRVWDVDLSFESPEAIILEGIRRMEAFFSSLGLPVRLSQLDIDETNFGMMAKRVTARGPVGRLEQLGEQDVLAIYRLAL